MDVDELVRPVSDLLSLPDACLRANALLSDPTASMEEIGEVINYDPALTAKLLKIVNSAFYGMPSPIDTVTRAIMVIGTNDLQALVLATSAVATFNQISTDLVDMEAFWHHSVFTALAAKHLAREARIAQAESVFVAALLHDVGKLILYQELPDQSQQVLERCADVPVQQAEVEREILGFDHGDVGAALLRVWKLPENLIEPIKFHHQPQLSKSFPKETSLVHIANAIAHTVEPGIKAEIDKVTAVKAIEPLAWQETGLSMEVITPTVHTVNLQSFELLEIIAPTSLLIL